MWSGSGLRLGIALSLLLSGCSWAFVQRPPKVPAAAGQVECTTGRGAPIADTVLASLGGALAVFGGVVIATNPNDGNDNSSNADDKVMRAAGTVLIATGLIVGFTYLVSASSGFEHTRRCRALRASH